MTTRIRIMPTALRRACLMLVVCGALLPGQAGFAAGIWAPLANPPPAPVQLMLLLSDGTVMAAGVGSNTWFKLTPDTSGNYVNGTWTTLASMANTRLFYSSAVLQDGRVFVAGGELGTGGFASEVYNPLTDTWTSAGSGPNNEFFSDSMSKILPNGNMLVAPVAPSQIRTLIYNPTSNTWATGVNALGSQNEASWVKLPDDSILTVDKGTQNSERYIPATGQWIADANVPVQLYEPLGRELGAALLLPDGRAFFLGGTGNTALYIPTGNTNPGTWVAGPNIPAGLTTPDAPAAMMVNGKILCAVSPLLFCCDVNGNNVFPVPTSFYEYDPSAGAIGAFTQVSSPTGGLTDNVRTFVTAMLDLPNGRVLYSNRTGLFVYQPDGVPLAAGKPTISTISTNPDGTFHLTGTLFNGISEGAAYGDDFQMDTNYPLVRMRVGSIVIYARTHDWSSTSVQTGSQIVSTEFTLPIEVFGAGYTLEVVANGIGSDPMSFAGPVWVDFNHSGFQVGSFDFPWSTLTQGRDVVQAGGTIMIKGNASSPETLTISTPMTLVAIGGPATIGQ